jgi:two-component system response regulator VicR
VDIETGEVEGGPGRLTTRERELLLWLAERPGQAVSRDELRTALWGYAESSSSRAVDSTVARLRRKIEEDPSNPRFVLKRHGEGYRRVVSGAPQVSPARIQAEPRG